MVNAILDHEMHAGAMTDDEAMELLVGRAFQTEGEAVGKIIRVEAVVLPALDLLRRPDGLLPPAPERSRELGDRFDLRPLPRGGPGPRHAAGEVSARAVASFVERREVTCDLRLSLPASEG